MIFQNYLIVLSGDKARSTSEGAGLGLSIANWIVEKHYGKISVESKWGEDTCFEVIFLKTKNIVRRRSCFTRSSFKES